MITIITVGSDKMFKEQENDYLKRITHYKKAELIELKNNKSRSEKEIIKKESELITSKIKDRPYIALDPLGAIISTEDFTNLIKNTHNPIFIIGGTFGLSESVKDKAEKTISLSRMTFTHEMARILLLEQIYRSITIERNMKYHK